MKDAIDALHEFQEQMKRLANDPEFQEQLRLKEEDWRRELAIAERTLRPFIKPGDLIRVNSCHSTKLDVYEVSTIELDGPVSQPAHFKHNWVDITDVYRYDDIVNTFVPIWSKSI